VPGRKPDKLFANFVDLSDSFFCRRPVFVLNQNANSPDSFYHLWNDRTLLYFAVQPEKFFFEVIEQNRLPNQFGALRGIILKHECTERFGATQPPAKTDELCQLFTLDLNHSALEIGKDAVPFIAGRRPFALVRIFHDAPAAP